MNRRDFDADIMKEIKERWSPRAFAKTPVDPVDIKGVLEAARYAPSCFNEQPWRFILGDSDPIRGQIFGLLTEKNQRWAKRAPVLILIVAQKLFEQTGKDNPWHAFDSGTAWGFLALEAWRRGLITHGMGGFHKKDASALFDLSEHELPIAVIALGYQGDPKVLDEEQQLKEHPSLRRKASESVLIGWNTEWE
ncbi:MAG: nitroreductase [Firmicutes bacterium HGW-Firmicutes-11]|jgi:nitroreductase|nr:MAG: nitroreductase [Firmicutes bacterium HGW-Firmicutes-11]